MRGGGDCRVFRDSADFPPMDDSAASLIGTEPFVLAEDLPSGRVLVRDATVSADTGRALAPALEDALARHARAAVVGAKRVRTDSVAAHGCFVLHPKGFVRNGRGAPRDAERFDAETDAIDAGVAVFSREAFESARGAAICDPRTGYGALALLALSLEVRRRGGGRVISAAAAECPEDSGFDALFATRGLDCEIARSHFRAHFHFDIDGCDLESVAGAEGLAALRWNAPIWGAPQGFLKYDERGAYHWNQYATHDPYRRRADAIVSFLVTNLPKGDAPIIDVGAGDALFAGLVARHDARVVAVDPEPRAVECAQRAVAEAGLAARVSCVAGHAESLPFGDGSFRGAMLLDVVEHLRNPVRALREIRRMLLPGGMLLTVTPSWRYGHRNDPIYHLDEYREEELVRQLKACGFAIAGTARIRGAYDDLVVLAQRMD